MGRQVVCRFVQRSALFPAEGIRTLP